MRVKSFPLRSAYDFAGRKNLHAEAAHIQAIPSMRGFRYNSGVRRAHMIELFADKGVLDEFIDTCWPEGRSPAGRAKMALYARRRIAYEALAGQRPDDDDDEDGSDSVESDADENYGSAFAYERDLQNFLAKNLGLIESGLELYTDARGSELEYPVDGGRIDILAKARDGTLVVIELKLSSGRSKAIGQLLYYMGWVDENLGNPIPCRGVLIAQSIGADVLTAVRRTRGVELFQYRLQVALERIDGDD